MVRSRIYFGSGDPELDEINKKIEVIEKREGLEKDEYFLPDNPDTPNRCDYAGHYYSFECGL